MSEAKPTKTMLWLFQLRRCFYCRKYKDLSQLTYDHFIPRRAFKKTLINGGAKGWHRSRWNLVLACHDCNSKKGHKMPTEEHRKLYRLLFNREPPTVKSLTKT